jgi:hypothetical protein
MRKQLAKLAARGWNTSRAITRLLLSGLALTTAVTAFSAPADIARGLTWLQAQAQAQAQGQLAVSSQLAAPQQARCETANTLIQLSGKSGQVAALVASLEEATVDAATQSLACWQQMR